ncbi:hypothetical protein [Litoreibacter albidus]|uniref:hypothetical protein n=1 Tax=Litoreibacter albidus TaxID=670155 RepID=UPI00373575D4
MIRALDGSQHIAVFGESGNGKTWLYQKVLKSQKCPYRVVDLSIALTNGLDNAFRDALTDPYGWTPEVKNEKSSGGAKIGIEAMKEQGTQYTFADKPPFDQLIDELAKLKGKAKFLVFDNMEQVSDDPELMRYLAGYLIRLDNPRFAKSEVRFLLVGVVPDMKKMLTHSANTSTISNRIYELPEVKRLSRFEAEKIFRTGFFDVLELEFEEEDTIISSAVWYSGRSAQQVHELGYNIACDALELDEPMKWTHASQSVLEWAQSSLAGHASIVQARMNNVRTTVQRRNQVLYCIAKSDSDDFLAADVDRFLRDEFPHNTTAAQLGVDQILNSLTDGENPILRRDSATRRYRLTHPKLRIAIRYVLRKNDEGNVAKNEIVDGPYFN